MLCPVAKEFGGIPCEFPGVHEGLVVVNNIWKYFFDKHQSLFHFKPLFMMSSKLFLLVE